MNYIFQDEEIDNGFFNFLQPNHYLEELDIDVKVMNTVDKAMEQYSDVKFAIQSESNQWSQIDNNFDINSKKDLTELDQDVKIMSLAEDNVIDTNLQIDDTFPIKEKNFNISVNPTTKITNNSASKLDDTNAADKLKAENNEKTKLKSRKANKTSSRLMKPKAEHLDFCDQDSQKIVKEKKIRLLGYSRWGRQKDIQLFQTLKQICDYHHIDIDDFWNSDAVMLSIHEKVLKELKYQVKWKRTTSAMLARIKMLVKNQSLSVRQCVLLRRLVAKAKSNKTKLVVEDIAYMFPGKLISTLESWLNGLRIRNNNY